VPFSSLHSPSEPPDRGPSVSVIKHPLSDLHREDPDWDGTSPVDGSFTWKGLFPNQNRVNEWEIWVPEDENAIFWLSGGYVWQKFKPINMTVVDKGEKRSFDGGTPPVEDFSELLRQVDQVFCRSIVKLSTAPIKTLPYLGVPASPELAALGNVSDLVLTEQLCQDRPDVAGVVSAHVSDILIKWVADRAGSFAIDRIPSAADAIGRDIEYLFSDATSAVMQIPGIVKESLARPIAAATERIIHKAVDAFADATSGCTGLCQGVTSFMTGVGRTLVFARDRLYDWTIALYRSRGGSRSVVG
jgi:hypothetical protein